MTEETTPLPPSTPDVPATDDQGKPLPDDVADGIAGADDEPAGSDAAHEIVTDGEESDA